MTIQSASNQLTHRRYMPIYCNIVVLIMAVSWITWRAMRQSRLDNALIAAIKTSNVKAVQALLSAGADANAIEYNQNDQSPIASWSNLFGKLLFRKNRTNGLTALLLTIRGNDKPDAVPTIQRYIDNDRDSEMLPESNTCKIVKALLEKGADVRARDSYGRTPLVILLQKRHDVSGVIIPDYQSCRELIKSGSDVNARDENGNTVLILAMRWSYPDMVNCLVERGADVNSSDSSGRSPLCYCRNIEIAKILLCHGAKINGNNRKLSPLSIAIKCANKPLIQYLMLHGAAAD
jgi:hypothetical protein